MSIDRPAVLLAATVKAAVAATVTSTLATTLALVPAAPAQAAGYPARPVSITTGFPVGSGPDVVLREVADRLARLWGQRVIVENKPGGGGFIAIDTVRRNAPDGYSLLQLDSEQLAALPHLYRQRNYDALAVFDPVASQFRTPFLVAIATGAPWRTMADLITAARAAPGKLTYGSWGVGSPGHLGAIMLEEKSGVSMEHVPYRETAQLFMAVGNGDINWSFGSIPSSQAAYKSGKIRYLAVAAPARIPQMPDVPTVAEAGGPADLDVNSFVVLVAPKGIAPAIRDRISADVAKVIDSPEVRARFDTFAFQPIHWTPDEIRRQTEAKSVTYKTLIDKNNIRLD